MSDTTITVLNSTSNPLRVIGSRGADLSSVAIGSTIQPNYQLDVAVYDWPTSPIYNEDNYDWVYLLDTVTLSEYQIYMEVNQFSGHSCFFFGYYDPSSSEENGNPLPFPDSSSWSATLAARNVQVTYQLKKTPPPLQNGPYQSFLLPPGEGVTPIALPLSPSQSYFWNAANFNSNTDTFADVFLTTPGDNNQPGTNILDGSQQFQNYIALFTIAYAPINDPTDYSAWLVGDYDGDGIADLFGIKVNNTGGNVQVCVLDGSSQQFQNYLLPLTDTPIPASDAANYRWALGVYGGDQTPSVWGIKVSNTNTKTVEAHALNGGEQYKTFLWQHGTVIPVADAMSYGAWAMVEYNNGHLNLCGIKVANTITGMVEVHIVDGSNDLESYLLQAYTCISSTDAANYGGWAMADYLGNGFQDLFGIKVASTTSNKVEVVILNGAYQS